MLGEHPSVTACTVDVRPGPDFDRRLVAYVVLADATPMADLRAFLRARLPDAFVPAVIVPLLDLPRTTSGKVNRAQLPDPGGHDIALPAARPLTDTETKVLRLWKETLGRRDIGLTDSFFDLGGHSLSAVRLFVRIEEAFGRRFPLGTIFQHNTVADLSRALDSAMGITPWTPLVPIAAGTRPPLFLVHGIGGEVLTFRELALLLQDRRVYGIQAAGPGSSGEPAIDIDGLASRYADEIASVEPEGPYHVGGYSSGGVLALALANELRSRGRPVALVLLLDAGRPGSAAGTHRARHSTFSFARQVFYWLGDDACRMSLGDWFRRIRSKASLARATRGRGTPLADVDIRDQLGMWLFPPEYEPYLRERYNAFRAYVPAGYPGRTAIIRSRTGRLLAPPVAARDNWLLQLLTGSVERHIVPGSHHNLLHQPFLPHVARIVDAALAAAEQSLAAGISMNVVDDGGEASR